MITMHEHMMSGGTMASGGMMGSGDMKMPMASATAEDIPGGARLVLVPRQADQLAALREHVHMHAERMANGRCPMMAMEQP